MKVVSRSHRPAAYPLAPILRRRERSRPAGFGRSGASVQTASSASAGEGKGRRSITARGAPVTRTVQRAGTWHEQRGSSARHLPMTHGRERGTASTVNSARHGNGCNLPAHLHSRTPRSINRSSRCTRSRSFAAAHASSMPVTVRNAAPKRNECAVSVGSSSRIQVNRGGH